MNHKKTLIRISLLFMTTIASAALAKEDCPIGQKQITGNRIECLFSAALNGRAKEDCPAGPEQIEGKTFKWEVRRYAVAAMAGTADKPEEEKRRNMKECTMTPRTYNPRTLYNRNWYLYKCGDIQLVRVETYITCQEENDRILESLRGNRLGQRLSQIVGDYGCSINPVVASDSWLLRDKRGTDFPLYKNENIIGPLKTENLVCIENGKWELRDTTYEVGGITSKEDRKYYVIIRNGTLYTPVAIPEIVPSL